MFCFVCLFVGWFFFFQKLASAKISFNGGSTKCHKKRKKKWKGEKQIKINCILLLLLIYYYHHHHHYYYYYYYYYSFIFIPNFFCTFVTQLFTVGHLFLLLTVLWLHPRVDQEAVMVRSAPSPAENKASFLRELSEGCVVKKESGLGSMTRFAEVMISHVLLPLRFLLLFLLPGLFLMLLLLLLVATYLYLSPRIVFFSVDILINPPTLQCLNSSLVKIILP